MKSFRKLQHIQSIWWSILVEVKTETHVIQGVITMKKASAKIVMSALLASVLLVQGCGTGYKGRMVGKDAEKKAATIADNAPKIDDSNNPIAQGKKIIDLNFDDGGTSSFGSFTEGGEFYLANKDGMLDVKIVNVGYLDYSNQAFWDGFPLVEGCEYTYSFDIKSDIERKVEYRLQINGGDYHAYKGEYIKVGTEITNFKVDFVMKEKSDPAPRLVFNMGFMDDMDKSNKPSEHHVYIDNICLQVKDNTNAKAPEIEALPSYLNVAVNQLGYRINDEKTVFVKTEKGKEDFFVVNAETGKIAWQGKLSETADDPASKSKVARGDFSGVNQPGTYYIYTEAGSSYTFRIGDDVYADLYKDVVLMLYRQRCGVATDKAIAGEDFAHEACHTGEAKIFGTDKKKDVSGGWHDAGDYGRYVVSGAKTVADLFAAYEDYGVKADNLGVPESGNGTPDLLDEARFELDWMLKMQDDETGGVYHKVTGMTFPGMSATPEKETAEMVIAPVSTTATGDFAAVMARAAIIYKDIDAAFAAKAYEAAAKAWKYIADNNDTTGFKNPEGMDTGEYPDTNTLDERFWAAAELYLAANIEAAGAKKSDADTYAAFIKKTMSDSNLKLGLGWTDMAMYAVYDLAKSSTEFSADAKKLLLAEADKLISAASGDRYYQSLGTNYYWGSNMGIASNGELLYMAARVADEKAAPNYKKAASKNLDYLLGANAMGYSFVTGYGEFSPKKVHHRPSVAAGKAMPGMLVGGADNALEDDYAKKMCKNEAPSMCYVDNDASYSTNEVTVYWNSPLIYILAAEGN